MEHREERQDDEVREDELRLDREEIGDLTPSDGDADRVLGGICYSGGHRTPSAA